MAAIQHNFSQDAIRRTTEQYIAYVRAHSEQKSGEGVQEAESDFHARFSAKASESGWAQGKIDAYWTQVEEMCNVLA